MLLRWAVATFDTTAGSLTYTKPRLAARLQLLESQATRWLQQHAAYLPLISDPTTQLARNGSVVWEWVTDHPTWGCRGVRVPKVRPNRALLAAQRRLAWAMASSDRLVESSPIGLLDYDPFRRVAWIYTHIALARPRVYPRDLVCTNARWEKQYDMN